MTRPYGRGTMRERSPGVWELRVAVGRDAVTGRHRQISRTIRGGKRAATSALNALVTASREDAGGTNATFGRLLDDWLDQTERAGRAATTLDTYRQHVEHRIRPALGDVRLPDLTTHRIDGYLSTLDGHLAVRTIALIRSIIRAACEQGVRWGWIARNPVSGTTVRRLPEPDSRPMAPEDVWRVVERCVELDGIWGRAVAFAALTGARRGEVLGLRWSDVTPEPPTVTIRRNVTPAKGGTHVGPPKNGKPRTIPVPQAAGILAATGGEWVSRGFPPAPDRYVFGADDGQRPWRPASLSELFQTTARSLGVDAHLHQLRKAAVTKAILAGWDVTSAALYFGHTPQVMLGVYSLGDADRARELAAGL